MASVLGEWDVRAEVISGVLNHTPLGITRRVYDRSRLLKPMLEAMEMWSLHANEQATATLRSLPAARTCCPAHTHSESMAVEALHDED
jgi:hypothetical protein